MLSLSRESWSNLQPTKPSGILKVHIFFFKLPQAQGINATLPIFSPDEWRAYEDVDIRRSEVRVQVRWVAIVLSLSCPSLSFNATEPADVGLKARAWFYFRQEERDWAKAWNNERSLDVCAVLNSLFLLFLTQPWTPRGQVRHTRPLHLWSSFE